MKRVTTIVTACAAVLLTLTISVAAQDFNTQEKTFMTFSGPVELPGLRLEAGTYVFRLADSQSRNVVQVLSQDEKDILGQWLFVQAERPEVSGETVVTFRETTPGATPAVQYWYYPGEKIGKEFVYPKDQAMRIAARTGVSVQSTEGEISAGSTITQVEAAAPADVSTPATSETTAPAASAGTAGVVEGAGLPDDQRTERSAFLSVSVPENWKSLGGGPIDDSQAQASAGVAADTEIATDSQALAQDQLELQAVGTSGVAVEESTSARADLLPATASRLALSGLLGLLSMAGAGGIRFFRS